MTETAVATPDPEPERDWEGDFYKQMATVPSTEMTRLMMDLRKDTFDASIGPSIGRTADDNVGMLLVFTDGTGKMLLDAWMSWHDHKCEAALAAMMGWLVHQMMLLEMFAPAFPQAVRDAEFFTHEGHEHEGPEYE